MQRSRNTDTGTLAAREGVPLESVVFSRDHAACEAKEQWMPAAR